MANQLIPVRWEEPLRQSAVNTLDKVNEIVDFINTSDIHEFEFIESGTGESVQTGTSTQLAELAVYGKSVQDGTPTPDNPVPVQVVGSLNIYDFSQTRPQQGTTSVEFLDNGVRVYTTTAGAYRGALTPITLIPGKSYYGKVHIEYVSGNVRVGFRRVSDNVFVGIAASNVMQSGDYTFSLPNYDGTPVYLSILVTWSTSDNGDATCTNMMISDTQSDYLPYGCIGLQIGETVTPIDLQGHVLASLPDGTRDVLRVDSAGRMTLEKHVRITNLESFDGNINFAWSAAPNTFFIRKNSLAHGISGFNTRACYCEQMTTQYTPANLATNQASGKYAFAIGNNDNFYLNVPGITTAAQAQTWISENKPKIYIPYETAETINLGYMTPPAIPSGSVITIGASLTPTIDVSWWTEQALPAVIAGLKNYVDSKIDAVNERINTLHGITQTISPLTLNPVNEQRESVIDDPTITSEPEIIEEAKEF